MDQHLFAVFMAGFCAGIAVIAVINLAAWAVFHFSVSQHIGHGCGEGDVRDGAED